MAPGKPGASEAIRRVSAHLQGCSSLLEGRNKQPLRNEVGPRSVGTQGIVSDSKRKWFA